MIVKYNNKKHINKNYVNKSTFKKKYLKLIISLTLFCSFISYADCSIFTFTNSVDREQLWQDFSYLAADNMQGRKTGSSGSDLAQQYLTQRFAQIGLQSFSSAQPYRLPFRYETTFSHVDGVNIAGYVTGHTFPERYIVVTAHYDHIGMRGSRIFNGADDNASGVSAMLALASNLVESGSAYSIIFLATDAEEKGLYGSKAFVQKPPVALTQIKYNLNLDMVSQNQGKNRLYVSGARYHSQLKSIVKQAIDESGLCLVDQHRSPGRGFSVVGGSNWREASDHASFGKVDIPYLFVGVTEHTYYHTEKDTVDKVDPDFFQAAVETSYRILQLMDKVTD